MSLSFLPAAIGSSQSPTSGHARRSTGIAPCCVATLARLWFRCQPPKYARTKARLLSHLARLRTPGLFCLQATALQREQTLKARFRFAQLRGVVVILEVELLDDIQQETKVVLGLFEETQGQAQLPLLLCEGLAKLSVAGAKNLDVSPSRSLQRIIVECARVPGRSVTHRRLKCIVCRRRFHPTRGSHRNRRQRLARWPRCCERRGRS
mmetsp:Transcript_8979/g.22848  ORF Transcript_8979/g.22848 Transcript_8979/m.22848 type:complete len:208 (-) Transcript_8979:1773-2396(-)